MKNRLFGVNIINSEYKPCKNQTKYLRQITW